MSAHFIVITITIFKSTVQIISTCPGQARPEYQLCTVVAPYPNILISLIKFIYVHVLSRLPKQEIFIIQDYRGQSC